MRFELHVQHSSTGNKQKLSDKKYSLPQSCKDRAKMKSEHNFQSDNTQVSNI